MDNGDKWFPRTPPSEGGRLCGASLAKSARKHSLWVSSTARVCWSSWRGGLAGAQEADPSVDHGPVSHCWKMGGYTPTGLKTVGCRVVP